MKKQKRYWDYSEVLEDMVKGFRSILKGQLKYHDIKYDRKPSKTLYVFIGMLVTFIHTEAEWSEKKVEKEWNKLWKYMARHGRGWWV